jgi:hypothetical protein
MAYKTIEAAFWRDLEVRSLSNEAKLLLLFFITGPESHYTGLFWMPKYVPQHELGWSAEQLDQCINELCGMGMDRGIGKGMQTGTERVCKELCNGYAMGIDTLSEEKNNRKPHFFIRYHEEHHMLWVKSMLRYQVGDKPLNTKQLKGVLNHIKQFRKSDIVAEFLAYYADFFRNTIRQKELDMKLSAMIKELYDLYDMPFFKAKTIPLPIPAAATAAATETEDENTACEREASHTVSSVVSAKRQKPLITTEQIEALYSQFNGTEEKARLFISNMAEDNKSGTVKNSRIYSTLIKLLELKQEYGAERFEYGLAEANTRGVPNINYIKAAAKSFDRKPQSDGGKRAWED